MALLQLVVVVDVLKVVEEALQCHPLAAVGVFSLLGPSTEASTGQVVGDVVQAGEGEGSHHDFGLLDLEKDRLILNYRYKITFYLNYLEN